jgi:hypothetical protein
MLLKKLLGEILADMEFVTKQNFKEPFLITKPFDSTQVVQAVASAVKLKTC